MISEVLRSRKKAGLSVSFYAGIFALGLIEMTVCPKPATAAVYGDNCCSDLEDRIAELETAAAAKGNRKVALTLTGHINTMLMVWDDGFDNDAYVVGNANDSIDQTSFQFAGDTKIAPDWSAGYQITVRVNDNLSADVSQTSDDNTSFTLWEAYWFVENNQLGRIAIGQAPRATDTVPESDLSGTRVAAFSGVQSIGGSFAIRRNDGTLTGVAWSNLHSHFNGDTANVTRYDTPEIAGFTLSASWGEDDIWDIAAFYAADSNEFVFEAAAGYAKLTDQSGLDGSGGGVDNNTIAGSASLLHKPTGLNATIAGGLQTFDALAIDSDGVQRTPADPSYIYAKLGWASQIFTSLGQTAFYGEYGRFEDFATVGTNPAGLDAITGTAARVTGSESEVWGVGVVQHIDTTGMQLYLGYRRYQADFNLVDNAGNNVATAGLENFQTIIFGTLVPF